MTRPTTGTILLRPEARDRHLEPLVELLHVSRGIVDGVSLSIARGELVALVGPAGSGKSTLLHMMAALDVPEHGRVVVDDIDIGASDQRVRRELRARRIGLVHARPYLLESLSVIDNVMLPMVLVGLSSREARERAHGLLERCGVARHAAGPTVSLDLATLQRVVIARALANDPVLMLIDEPSAMPAAFDGEDYYELVRSLHSEARTTVIATGDAQVAGVAPRRVHLRSGHVVDDEEEIPR